MIFSIAGATVLFVLQKFTVGGEMGDNYYKLIGECHLQGAEEIEAESGLVLRLPLN